MQVLGDGTQTVSFHGCQTCTANPSEISSPPLGHPIADAHPGNLDDILFPGQDYNNARVYDFHNVRDWNQNKREKKTKRKP